jgi:peptidoglycan/LPS O-acetylase OafA/YrhL
VKILVKIDTKFLDGTRFLLALSVAIGHFYNMIGGKKYFGIPVIGGIGANAVDGFIVITGFLMMYHYLLRANKEPLTERVTFYRFWVRRFFRLYPVYLIAIIAAFFLQRHNSIYHINILKSFTGDSLNAWGEQLEPLGMPTISDLFTHITFTHGLIPQFTSSILGPAWSLSLEVQYYFLFPFIVFIFFFTNNSVGYKKVFYIGFFVTIFLSIVVHYFSSFGQPSTIIHKLPLFLLGMVIAAFALKKIELKHLLISILFIFPYELVINVSQNIVTNLIILFILFFLFLDNFQGKMNKNLYRGSMWIRNMLSSKVAEFGANISYSFYLIHIILMPFIINWVLSNFSLSKTELIILSFSIFIVINLLLSHFLYKAVEKPFINVGKKIKFVSSQKKSRLQKKAV